MTACLDGVLSDQCGVFGDCVEDICVCQGSWSKSLDFFADSEELDIVPCDTQDAVLKGFYALVLAQVVVVAAMHLLFVRRWSQIKRLSPLLSSWVLLLVFCAIKLNDISKSVFHDAAVTILYAIIFLFGNVSSLVFFTKYIHFQLQLVKLKPGIVKSMRKSLLLQRITFLADLTFSFLLITPLFIAWPNTEVLIRCALGLGAARAVFAIIHSVYLINLLLSDIVLSFPYSNQPSFDEKLAQRATTLKNIRFHIIWYNLFPIVIFGTATCWPSLIPLLKYNAVIMILASQVMVVMVLANYQQARLLKFYKKPTVKSSESVHTVMQHSNISAKDMTSASVQRTSYFVDVPWSE